jgi:hypothetical protein
VYRTCLAAAAALLLAGCSKAPEDVTASYAMGGRPAGMTVKAAGNGDARVDMMGSTLIHHDGADYLVSQDSQGSFAAKVDDFVALSVEAIKARGFTPPPRPAEPDYDVTKGAAETIAGEKGDLWTVAPKGDAAGPKIQAVISTDPALVNVGKAVAMQNKLTTGGMAELRGGIGKLEKSVQDMLGKGAMLRFGDEVKLEKVTKGPLPAADFALPGTVLDRAGLKARAEAERARMMKMQQQMQGQMPGGGVPPVAPPAPVAGPSAAPTAAPKK